MNASAQKLERETTSAFSKLATVATVSLAAVATAVVAASTVFGTLIGLAVSTASAFESNMSIVQAITRGTAQEMGQLTDAMREVAKTTVISMSSAAEAAGELARGGVSIRDSIDGALKAVIDLSVASAGELELGRSATLVASALNAFSLKGEDAAMVANAITAAAQKSSITFVDLQRSFQQAAAVAGSFGLTVSETAAALGVLGVAGLRGSDAGTSLKQMFIQLAKPSKAAIELMNQYGISIFTAAGATRPFRDLVIDLQNKFGDAAVATGKITAAERNRALATIFGSDALRASLVLAQQGVGVYDDMVAAQTDATFSAEELARVMQDNLSSQFTILQNNVGSLLQLLGSGFIGVLRSLVDSANEFARSMEPVISVITGFIASIGDIGNLGPAFADLEKLFGEQVASVVERVVAAIISIADAVNNTVIPAFGGLVAAVGAFAANQTNVDAFKTAIDNIATALLVAASAGAEIINFLSNLIREATASEERLRQMHTALFALTVIPLAGLVVILGAIALAAIKIIAPFALIALAIGGAITALASFGGLFDQTIGEIEQAVDEADLSLVPAVAETEEGLNSIETAFDETLAEVDKLIVETDLNIEPDVSVTERATKSIVDAFIEAALAIGTTVAEFVGFTNTELDSIDVDQPARKFEALASTVDRVAKFIEIVINQRLGAIERFFHVIANTATVFWTITAASVGIFLSALSEAEKNITNFLSGVLDAFGITVDGTSTAWNSITDIVGRAVEQTGKDIDKIIEFLGNILQSVRLTLIGWAQSWKEMGGVVGVAAGIIGSHIDGIVTKLEQLSKIELPRVDLSGIGDVADETASAIDASVTAASASLAGFRERLGSIRTDFAAGFSAAAPPIAGIERNLRGLRDEADTTAGSMGGLGDETEKAAKKAKQAAEEALPAINGFLDAIAKATRLQSFIDAFGDAGADAVNALVDAVVSNIDKDGAKAAEALHKFVQELRKANVEDWAAFNDELQGLFAAALIEQTDEAIDLAKAALGRAADAMKAQGQLTLGGFVNAFKLGEVAERIGSDGARLMENLKEAITKGGTEVIREVGANAVNIVRGFAKELNPEQAAAFTRQFMDAVTAIVREKTPQTISALENLLSRLNFDAVILKAQNARDKALGEARKGYFENIKKIRQELDKELKEMAEERMFAKQFEAGKQAFQDYSDSVLDGLRSIQDHMRRARAEDREARDRDVKDQRDADDKALDRAEQMAEAIKAKRKRLASGLGGTPVGGLTITGNANKEKEEDEVKKLEERWRKEDAREATKKARELADRAQAKKDQAADLLFELDLDTQLDVKRREQAAALQVYIDGEEERQQRVAKSRLIERANEGIRQENRRLAETTTNENRRFQEVTNELNSQRALADSVMDGLLEDLRLANDEVTRLFTSRSSEFNVKIEQVNSEVEGFAGGGFVGGRRGEPRLVMAHGGEYISSLADVLRAERSAPSIVNNRAQTNNNTYQVNASYANVQSPVEIADDMAALLALVGR